MIVNRYYLRIHNYIFSKTIIGFQNHYRIRFFFAEKKESNIIQISLNTNISLTRN
jgi:hypothetical protein